MRLNHSLQYTKVQILLILVCGFAAHHPVSGAQLFVGTSTIAAGSGGIVTLTYTSGGDRISSLQVDLAVDRSVMSVDIVAGSSVRVSGKSLYASTPNSPFWRIIITGINRSSLADGPLLTLFLNPLPTASPGHTSLEVRNVTAADPDGNAISVPGSSVPIGILPASGTSEPLQSGGVLNAASLLTCPVSPGEVISLIGSGIGPSVPMVLQLTKGGVVASVLSDTQLTFDSIPAPLTYAGGDQINALIPFEVAGPTTAMKLSRSGQVISTLVLQVTPVSAGLFTRAGTGVGQAAAANEDGSPNSPLNPASPGSIITAYVTGGGQTDPAGSTGGIASAAGTALAFSWATVDGSPAEITYAGPAPGLISGVMQVNLRVPQNTRSSPEVPLLVGLGSSVTQDGVTVAIR